MRETTIDIFNQNINIDYFHRPSLNLRVKAMFIDMVIVIGLMYAASLILNLLNIESGVVRATILGLVLLYEPIAVAFGSTFGQSMMGIRVSQFTNLKDNNTKTNIGFGLSLVRYATKLLLGLPSLLTVHSSAYGQALHDKISASIVGFR